MKHTIFFFAITAAVSFAALQGCGDDTDSPPATTTQGTGGSGVGGGTGGTNVVPPPALGVQIDRFGRPAINAALNHAFDADMAAKDAAHDTWNQDSEFAGWSTTYGPEIAKNLAVLDALDTICGNQPLAAPDPITPTRYATLGGALADDRLWVNTAGAACTTYLAVEANAALGATNTDCGGRAPAYDVIDQSYSVLVAGDLTMMTGDGIDANDADFSDTFPYLADPH